MVMQQKTFIAREQDVERKSYIIDADGIVLGKIAVKAANILRGKHKAIYTPNVDTGDQVIIINAAKVRVSGKKAQDKMYKTYSGFHSGQKEISFEKLMAKSPEKIIELAVYRMIPSGPLGNKVKTKLKVYAGDTHPHAAQKPIPLEV